MQLYMIFGQRQKAGFKREDISKLYSETGVQVMCTLSFFKFATKLNANAFNSQSWVLLCGFRLPNEICNLLAQQKASVLTPLLLLCGLSSGSQSRASRLPTTEDQSVNLISRLSLTCTTCRRKNSIVKKRREIRLNGMDFSFLLLSFVPTIRVYTSQNYHSCGYPRIKICYG